MSQAGRLRVPACAVYAQSNNPPNLSVPPCAVAAGQPLRTPHAARVGGGRAQQGHLLEHGKAAAPDRVRGPAGVCVDIQSVCVCMWLVLARMWVQLGVGQQLAWRDDGARVLLSRHRRASSCCVSCAGCPRCLPRLRSPTSAAQTWSSSSWSWRGWQQKRCGLGQGNSMHVLHTQFAAAAQRNLQSVAKPWVASMPCISGCPFAAQAGWCSP